MLNFEAETNSLHGYWLADSFLFVCQPFSSFSFHTHASILCWLLCANRPYAANSLTFPFIQRATGLLELMDATDTKPRWKDKSCSGESSRGGSLGEKPSHFCISSCSHSEESDLIENLGAQLWVVTMSLIYNCFRPCRVAEPTVGHPLTPDPWPYPLLWSVAWQDQKRCVWFIFLLLKRLLLWLYAFDLWIMPKYVFCHYQKLILSVLLFLL